MSGAIDYFQREAEANWIAQHQPDIWVRTHKYLLLSGYLNYRMTGGRYVDSIGSQVGYVPFDYKNGCWAPSWDWKWSGLPITPDMLPELVAPGTQIGAVGAEVAAQTGLPLGLPILAGAAGTWASQPAAFACSASCRSASVLRSTVDARK